MDQIKTIKPICVIVAAVLLAACFSACTDNDRKSVSYFDLFDTVITLTAYADDRTFEMMNEEAKAIFERYNKLFDIYTEYDGMNNLATVNRMAGEWVEVETEIIGLLEMGVEFERLTKGSVNVAMGAVLKLWHECRINAEAEPEKARIPERHELVEASYHCDINSILIDKDRGAVMLADPKMSVDVGAIGKGYAADKASKKLKEYEAPFLLNCGGAVLANGLKPGNTEWEAGIDDPFGNGFIAKVGMRNCALSTSGSYLRKFSADGTEYGHIIDPNTLMPASGFELVSVTVYGENAACVADALSTACYILDYEDGIALIEEIGAEAVFVSKDGRISFTEGFPKR